MGSKGAEVHSERSACADDAVGKQSALGSGETLEGAKVSWPRVFFQGVRGDAPQTERKGSGRCSGG